MDSFTHEYASHWYHNPTLTEKSGGLWIVRGGKNKAKPNYVVGPRFINYFSLHFIFEGSGSLSFNNETFHLNSGDLFCLFPQQSYIYNTDPENLLHMQWIAIDGKQAPSLIFQIGLTASKPILRKVITEDLLTELNALYASFELDDKKFALHRLGHLFEIFHLLSLQNQEVDHFSSDDWIHQAKDYLNIHYTENLSVEDAAQYFGVHRSYFSDCFKHTFNISPKKYLVQLRMNKAYQMIEDETYSFTEIAHSTGYSDIYSFSRAFKNYYGFSPRQVKEN
ncbi:Msm operon regulatory protein [Pullulanibacillus camelliae]|uniref:Msm operon regulatory protein n=1 Tax=Pullulanibacillus camelliae TaxID=1707096 RepID=A0A8J2VJL5_9BACL|nr:AraC family transcriptional regulator [Pullulanibacillus camelliae]GGE26043.1 Msm operon regulatory protein [Pullulanibacillus camelliae]